MPATRREIFLSAPAVPILAMPAAAEAGEPPATVAQLVHRLDELSAEHDALFNNHAVPYWPGAAASGETYFAAAEVIDIERARLVRQLIGTGALTLAEICLKARIVGEHNVFPCPAALGLPDALVRSLLIDLGVHGA